MGSYSQNSGALPFNLYSLDPSKLDQKKYLDVWPIAIPLTTLARWYWNIKTMGVQIIASCTSSFDSLYIDPQTTPVTRSSLHFYGGGGVSVNNKRNVFQEGYFGTPNPRIPPPVSDRVNRYVMGQGAYRFGGGIAFSSPDNGFDPPFPAFATDYEQSGSATGPSGPSQSDIDTPGTGSMRAYFGLMYPQSNNGAGVGWLFPGDMPQGYLLGDKDWSVIRKPDGQWYPSLFFALFLNGIAAVNMGNPNFLPLITSLPPAQWSLLGFPGNNSAGEDPNDDNFITGVPTGKVGGLTLLDASSGETYKLPLYGYTGELLFGPTYFDNGGDGTSLSASGNYSPSCEVNLTMNVGPSD